MNKLNTYQKYLQFISENIPDNRFLKLMTKKNLKRYEQFLEFIKLNIPKENKIKILDFGCGFPVFSKILELELSKEVSLYEPAITQDIIKLSSEIGFKNIYSSINDIGHQKYDVIILSEVIEHVPIIGHLFNEINSLSKKGTLLFISTPNVLRYEIYIDYLLRNTGNHTPLNHFLENKNLYDNHQREFTKEELIKTLNFFGYDSIDFRFADSRPSSHDLLEYHKEINKNLHNKSQKLSIKSFLFRKLPFLFPKSFTSNQIYSLSKKN